MPSHPRHVALIAGPAHIALGLASTAGGVIGAIEVRRGLKAEGLVGTPGMPAPVAGRSVRTGLHARAFAAGMRRHALAATGGQTYAQARTSAVPVRIANAATDSAKNAMLSAVDSAVSVTHTWRAGFSTGWPAGSVAAAVSSSVGSPRWSR
jgi:hypothetical protein